jgi:hypothetical protein
VLQGTISTVRHEKESWIKIKDKSKKEMDQTQVPQQLWSAGRTRKWIYFSPKNSWVELNLWSTS